MMTTMLRRTVSATLALAAASACLAQSSWFETGGAGTFDTTNWTVDRYAPGGWTPGSTDPLGGDALKLTISNADREDLRPSGFGGLFYTTQGRKRAGALGTTAGGQVFIPSSWKTSGNLRRTDLWNTDVDSNGDVSAYPIVGFINNDPTDPFNPTAGGFVPRLRIYDINTGDWTNLSDSLVNYDQYNSFKVVETGATTDYYVNGSLVGSLNNENENVGIKEVMVQGYNFGNLANEGTLPDSGYDIFWRNVYKSDAPVAVDDSFTIDRNAPGLLNVVANDFSINGGATLSGWGFASHGQLNLQSGKIRYTPDTDYVGPDSFQYTVTDGSGLESTGTVSLNVQYTQLVSVTVDTPTVIGGHGATATVTLDSSPATESYTLDLSSTDGSLVVPATATVVSGNTITFPVTTAQVADIVHGKVRASFHGAIKTATMNVFPINVLTASAPAGSVLGGVADTTVTITLEDAPTLYPVTVNLDSSLPGTAGVQSSVVIPIGATSVVVPVSTMPVAAATIVKINASAQNSDPKVRIGTIRVAPVRVITLVASNRNLQVGQVGNGTITLNGTLKPGVSVNVAMTCPGNLISFPSTVTITGSNTTSFVYAAPPVSLGFKAIVTLSANLGGTHKSVTITVNK